MKQNTTYKQTELGLIPEDWEVKKLGDLVNIKSGDSPTKFKLSESNGKYPYLKVEDLNNCNKYQSLSRNYSNDKFSIVKENSIIFPKRGAAILNNKVRINIIPVQMDSNLMALTVKNEKSNVEFLYYKITKEGLFKIADTSTIPQINNKHILPYKIPLPPLPEQKKIANCLSTWDVAIEKQNALINALADRKKALMQQLLTGKKRLPGFSGEWKEVKMGDLFEKINRKNEEGNTNVVTISAQRGFVKQTDFFNKSVASETLDNYSLIYHGEFCYNKSYSNGYPLGATKRLIAFEKAVVTTLYICFKIKDQKKSNGSFFEQFFEANSLDRSLIKIAQEGGRAHGLLNVSLSDFFNIKIKLPPIEEQTAIAEILAAADRELQLQKEKLAQLQAQKKGLMQVLLTGKKRLIN